MYLDVMLFFTVLDLWWELHHPTVAWCIIHKPWIKYDDACIHSTQIEVVTGGVEARAGRWQQKSDLLTEVFTVRAHTWSVLSPRVSYLLRRSRQSMKLTEMYEHNVQQNEQAHRTFFIITHNDYELNFGGGKEVCKSISACSSASTGNESIRWWMGVIHAFTFYTSC